MKNATKFSSALAGCLLFAALLFTNVTTAQSVMGISTDKSVHPHLAKFHFDILISNCYYSGTTLTVQIANPELYHFYWEIDGGVGGRGITTASCVCGNIATVRVIRNRDGMQVVRTVNLPNSCPAVK